MIGAAAVSGPVLLGKVAGPASVQANYHRSLWLVRKELVVECLPHLGTTVRSQVAPPFHHLHQPASGDRRKGRKTSPHYVQLLIKFLMERFFSGIRAAGRSHWAMIAVMETLYTEETLILAFFSAATSAIFISRFLTWLFISVSKVVFI